MGDGGSEGTAAAPADAICYTASEGGVRSPRCGKVVSSMGFFKGSAKAPDMAKCDEVSVVIEPRNGALALPVCIEIPGGRAHEVIPAGVKLPYKTTQLFSTVDPYQLAAEFHLVAGSRPLVKDNIELGRVRIRDVKWAGAGKPKLEVSFNVAKDGTLTIGADNLDKKRTEMLAWLATDRVSAEQVRSAEEQAQAAREHDEWVDKCIDEMLVGYSLMDAAYERYAVAKKKLNPLQTREYKQARRRLEKALNVMPPEATAETMAELNAAREAFDAIYESHKPVYDAVMAWYDKK